MSIESEGLKYLERNINVDDGEWASKKLIWIPDKDKGFVEGSILNIEGEEVSVKLNTGESKKVSKMELQKMNPPKFDKVEDMCELPCLNEASVLHNISSRYYSGLIYTYSGLFCVVINPYRNIPIYSNDIANIYNMKRKTELPPHVYAISSFAYKNMIESRDNQSILCTGESGAGKTENTKKIIQYLAYIAKADKSCEDINQRLLLINPILESFGNAKTTKNDNSSRFGKFIKIYFDSSGFIFSVCIDTYLLEKSRVIRQGDNERNFHIFYQILSKNFPFANEFLLEDIKEYAYLTNGEMEVSGIDDSYTETFEALKNVGFVDEDIKNIYQILCGILTLGKIIFGKERNNDQGTLPDNSYAQKVCHLLGIQIVGFTQAILNPKLKVGSETVKKAQTKDQAIFSVESIGKTTYERLFGYIVTFINKQLNKNKLSHENFIGILDIAGFEIFKINGFEQLCINFTNEKLQQLFNHTMFILEQEEYKKENIPWDFIDFGLDLQPIIDLIEKPLGVFSILDEECVFPKSTHRSFVDKLNSKNENKDKFIKPDKLATNDFGIYHYAGRVNYNCFDWITKNTDPLNDNVVSILASSSNSLIAEIWKENNVEKKRGMLRTVSQLYKGQLNKLIDTLYTTNVHFVRCIIPNLLKKSGVIDPHLVLDQLRCNGVLEGIRICRQGFPNRVHYQNFVQRYFLLVSFKDDMFMDSRKATENMINQLELDSSLYRLGTSKIFFRTGVLSNLEEERDIKLTQIVTELTTKCRLFLSIKYHTKMESLLSSVVVIQQNCKNYINLREWSWFKLYSKLLPLVDFKKQDDEKKARENELNSLREKYDKLTAHEEERRQLINKLEQEISDKSQKLSLEFERNEENQQEISQLLKKITELENLIEVLNEDIQEMETTCKKNKGEINKLRELLSESERILKEQEEKHDKLKQDKTTIEQRLTQQTDDLSNKMHLLDNILKEKKIGESNLAKTEELLHAEEDQRKNMQKTIKKLETNIEELQNQLQKETNDKSNIQKLYRKLEDDHTQLQEDVDKKNTDIQRLTQNLSSKSEQLSVVSSKAEEEIMQNETAMKANRELKYTVEELKEELESEVVMRKNLEKAKHDLLKEIDEISQQQEETANLNEAERNLVREKENKVISLQRELEETKISNEDTLKSHKKQSNEMISKIREELESVKKSENVLMKKLKMLENEKEEMIGETSNMMKTKQDGDKKRKQLENEIMEMGNKNSEYEKQNNDLNEIVNKSKNEITKLTEINDKLENNNTELERKLKTTLDKLEDVKSKLGDEEDSVKKSNSQINRLESKISELNDQIEEECTNSEVKGRQILQLQSKYDDALKEMRMVNEEKEERENSTKKLQKELESIKTELEIMSNLKHKAEKSSSNYHEELMDAMTLIESNEVALSEQGKKQKKFDIAMSEVKSLNDNLTKERDKLEQEIRNSESKLLSLTRQLQDTNTENEELTKKQTILTKELSDVKSTVSGEAADNVNMKSQLREYKKKTDELSSQLEELQDELYTTQNDLSRKEISFQADRTDNSRRLNELNDECEEKIRNISKKMDELRDELESEQRAKTAAITAKKKMENDSEGTFERINELEGTVEELCKQNKKQNNLYKEKLSILENLQNENNTLNSSCNQLQSKLQSSINAANEMSERIEQLQYTLKNITSERDQNTTELQSSSNKLSQSHNENAQLKKTVNNLKADLEDEKTHSEELEDELRKSNILKEQNISELSSLKMNLDKSLKENTINDKKTKEMSVRMEEIQSELDKCNSTNYNLQSKLKKFDFIESQIEEEIRQRQESDKKLKLANKKMREVVSLTEVLQGDIDKYKSDYDTLISRYKAMKKQYEEAEDQADLNKNKLKKINFINEELEEQVQDLQNEINRLKKYKK